MFLHCNMRRFLRTVRHVSLIFSFMVCASLLTIYMTEADELDIRVQNALRTPFRWIWGTSVDFQPHATVVGDTEEALSLAKSLHRIFIMNKVERPFDQCWTSGLADLVLRFSKFDIYPCELV